MDSGLRRNDEPNTKDVTPAKAGVQAFLMFVLLEGAKVATLATEQSRNFP
jgi:hypothetical protein